MAPEDRGRSAGFARLKRGLFMTHSELLAKVGNCECDDHESCGRCWQSLGLDPRSRNR
jgi:hypothetical protein